MSLAICYYKKRVLLASLNEACWGAEKYGVQYDEYELCSAAIGFFVDRWEAGASSGPRRA